MTKIKNDNIERMKNGRIYNPGDEEIAKTQFQCLDKLYEYNNTKPSDLQKREELLKEMLGAMGKNCYIEQPFRANWGGKHLFLGDNVYVNSNLTAVDDGNIYVGDNVMFGPNVIIATASHPIEPNLRKKGYQFNLDVHIKNNVWIGAGVIIVPGVTIGENTVIGAGSVVTKDIEANVVAVGNPCKVLRKISEKDKLYYHKDKLIDIEI